MTIFSSGKNRSRVTTSRWGSFRPKYLPLHNPANPILAAFRERAMLCDAGWWADSALPGEDRLEGLGVNFTPRQFNHAVRVLRRLDTFEEGN